MDGSCRGGMDAASTLQGSQYAAEIGELATGIETSDPLLDSAWVIALEGGRDNLPDLDNLYDDFTIMDFR